MTSSGCSPSSRARSSDWPSTRVTGEVRQQGNTNQLMRSIPELIAYITAFMTLDRDDMILTGTPKGISPIHPGDIITMEISRIGVLENRIIAEDALDLFT